MVPLELPAIDPKQVSLPPAFEGIAPAAEGVALAEALTEEEQKKLESVGWRMLNLPLIVCHSANGMPFFFPLQKVSPTTPSAQALTHSLASHISKRPLQPTHSLFSGHCSELHNRTTLFRETMLCNDQGVSLTNMYSNVGPLMFWYVNFSQTSAH